MMRSLVFPALALTILLQTKNVAGFQAVQNTRQSTTALCVQRSDGHDTEIASKSPSFGRKEFLLGLGSVLSVGTVFPAASLAKSYSENAANLERINSGDFSGGAVFNNNPTTEGAKKRRAMTGCKTPIAREEAAQAVLKTKSSLGEKECNTMVMGGDTEFMLQALRNLDCPTCPNGIAASR